MMSDSMGGAPQPCRQLSGKPKPRACHMQEVLVAIDLRGHREGFRRLASDDPNAADEGGRLPPNVRVRHRRGGLLRVGLHPPPRNCDGDN